MSEKNIPIIDLHPWLSNPVDETFVRNVASRVVRTLCDYGAIIVRDTRLDMQAFEKPRALLEHYFAQPRSLLERDSRPELHHQVGLSLEGAEKGVLSAFERAKHWDGLDQPHRPALPYAGDPKLRFFIRLREARMRHEHDPLNYPPVIPEAFKDSWQKTMELWGEQLLTTGETILEMIEEVFDTEPGYLRRYTRGGPHLLGPNAANLEVLTEPATIINLFHSDLNLLTLHGPATYPGLRIWLRNGTSLFVKIPPGHVLVQVGQQMEWLTGGVMEAGMHEVIVTREALQMRRFKSSPWRISLPCFMHSASDMTLQVMPEAMRYADVAPEVVRERERRYPPLTVGEQVERGLRAIGLAAP